MSAEYGWTDDQIGDLPLVRFRQIVSAIQLRLTQARREARSIASWQTRTLSTYIAAGYMVEKGKENKALSEAQNIGYDAIDQALLGVESGGAKENTNGSFERLMGWAGAGMTKRP